MLKGFHIQPITDERSVLVYVIHHTYKLGLYFKLCLLEHSHLVIKKELFIAGDGNDIIVCHYIEYC